MTYRLKLLFGLLGVVMLAAVARVVTAPKTDAGHQHSLLARQAAERGDLVEQVSHLRQAVFLEPGNGDYHADLGGAYLQQNRYQRAAAELEMASYLAPDRPHIHCQLAQALVEERRRSEALQALDEALRRAPRCPHALSVRGEQYLRDGNFKDALPAFREVINLQPAFAMAYQKAGYILLSTNQTDEALAVLQKGLAISAQSTGIHALIGEAYTRKPQDPEAAQRAEEHYRAALAGNPEAAKVHAALGKLALRRKDLVTARQEYDAALSLQPGLGDALYGLSQVARATGDAKEAERRLKEFERVQAAARKFSDMEAKVAAHLTDASLHLELARQCASRGLVRQALKAANEAVRLDAQLREARELRTRLYLDLRWADEAAAEGAVASRLPRASAL